MDPNTIVLAALLHDIGKFAQRAGVPQSERYRSMSPDDFGFSGAHAKWSAGFVRELLQDETIEDLVLYHHMPQHAGQRALAEILRDADHLSAAIDRKRRPEKGRPNEEPLRSVFPEILLSERRSGPATPLYYPMRAMDSSDSLVPQPLQEIMRYQTNLSRDYERLWQQFVRECERLSRPWPIGALLSLLHRYTALVPSAVYRDEPDIPLYDHAKTTAAIAHCLLEGDAGRPYLLVQGDLSGIQDFIFATVIPEQARKRTAKRLRGRSFWLSLLTDAVTEELIAECGLTAPSVLWNTGGNFLVLVPNTPANRETIETISRRVNEHLLREFGGRLALSMVAEPATREEITDFASLMDRTRGRIERKKRQKFLECSPSFQPVGAILPITDYCDVCGTVIGDPDAACPACRLHEEIGTAIARARYLVRGDGLRFGFHHLGLGMSYDLLAHLPDRVFGEVLAINPKGDLTASGPTGGFLFLGNTVPIADREILSFNAIAQLSTGTPRLAYIKADVDNLGKIMARGLAPELRTISRIHALSRLLQYFFADNLNRLCHEFVVYDRLCPACMSQVSRSVSIQEVDDDDEPGVSRTLYRVPHACESCREHAIDEFYITYSGGDDLLIVGPWDDAIRLAARINEAFRRFTGENPDITLSAGVAIVEPRLPVDRSVRLAEGLLEKAKTSGKDRIALFDEVLSWKHGREEIGLAALISTADALMAAVTDRKVSRSLVHALLLLWRQTFDPIEKKDHEEQMACRRTWRRYLPQLRYLMKRNVNAGSLEEIEELIVPQFGWIKLPVYWTSLGLRERRTRFNGED